MDFYHLDYAAVSDAHTYTLSKDIYIHFLLLQAEYKMFHYYVIKAEDIELDI